MKAWLQQHWHLVIPLIAGACVGWAARGEHVKTVTVTEYKDRVVEKQVVVEKPVVTYRDRIIVRTVTKPDGTKVETHVDETSGRRTEGSTTTTEAVRETEVATRTVTAPEGRWSVRLLAGADTHGGIVAGVAGDYRLLGPVTVGVWGTGPVAGSLQSPWTLGVSLGARF